EAVVGVLGVLEGLGNQQTHDGYGVVAVVTDVEAVRCGYRVRRGVTGRQLRRAITNRDGQVVATSGHRHVVGVLAVRQRLELGECDCCAVVVGERQRDGCGVRRQVDEAHHATIGADRIDGRSVLGCYDPSRQQCG